LVYRAHLPSTGSFQGPLDKLNYNTFQPSLFQGSSKSYAKDNDGFQPGKVADGAEIGLDFDEDDEGGDPGMISRIVKSIHTGFQHVILENRKTVKILALLTLAGLYVAYLGVAIAFTVRNDITVDWCDGIGMLFILTGLGLWGLFYYFILKKYFGKTIKKKIMKPISKKLSPLFKLW